MLRCIEIFCTFLVHAIVFIIFHIGNFLSVNGFGHAVSDSFRNEHVVILLDMMLRARIARMNMRAMMVIVIGSIIMMNKGKRLHTSDVFYRFYHFPYWKLSVGKWLWLRYMRLFSK